MNLSRNELGNYAVQEIMKFLIEKRIAVQLLKLYKNWIGDDGLRAIGDLIWKTPDPAVQEIHLSHNVISEDGAQAVFEAVVKSRKYPCQRGKEPSPLWLRMENNNIVWDGVLEKLKERDFHWTSGDTRDAWRKEPNADVRGCPLVSMHRSYHHQTPQTESSSSRRGRHHDSYGNESDNWRSNRDREDWDDRGRGGRGDDNWDTWRNGRSSQDDHSGSGAGYDSRSWGDIAQERWNKKRDGNDDDRGRTAGSSGAPKGEANGEKGGHDVQVVQQFITDKMAEAAEAQGQKFNLIFSILHELQDKQTKLEKTLSDLQQQTQQQQQARVQDAPQQQQPPPQQQPQQQQPLQQPLQPHQPQATGYSPQMVPMDGGFSSGHTSPAAMNTPPTWGGSNGEHRFGTGVW
eukprot:TRINITY_DN1569_c0_g1_i2.p1 TRINITY_DN1569_c0_g1~~TRINITY_DN1569_c0_g1_i2.p1  ORF type:complete len:402 (+),score=99.72 TRINITY_DN1569_c0_g1_i2:418-1623(+)